MRGPLCAKLTPLARLPVEQAIDCRMFDALFYRIAKIILAI
jgi:hypothetical protein